ncbi:hypothetical protein M758_7G177000, partial [Ceratodon purpureus]
TPANSVTTATPEQCSCELWASSCPRPHLEAWTPALRNPGEEEEEELGKSRHRSPIPHNRRTPRPPSSQSINNSVRLLPRQTSRDDEALCSANPRSRQSALSLCARVPAPIASRAPNMSPSIYALRTGKRPAIHD